MFKEVRIPNIVDSHAPGETVTPASELPLPNAVGNEQPVSPSDKRLIENDIFGDRQQIQPAHQPQSQPQIQPVHQPPQGQPLLLDDEELVGDLEIFTLIKEAADARLRVLRKSWYGHFAYNDIEIEFLDNRMSYERGP